MWGKVGTLAVAFRVFTPQVFYHSSLLLKCIGDKPWLARHSTRYPIAFADRVNLLCLHYRSRASALLRCKRSYAVPSTTPNTRFSGRVKSTSAKLV